MLINCPECNKEISSEAKQCIHCGYPIADFLKQKEKEIKKKSHGSRKAYLTFGTIEYISIPITGFFIVFLCIDLILTELEPFHSLEATIFFIILVSLISQGILQIIVFGILKHFFKEK